MMQTKKISKQLGLALILAAMLLAAGCSKELNIDSLPGNEAESVNAEFRKKFITNTSYSEDQVPQSVEDYVINTLGISRELVNSYRKAMGVTE